MIDHGPHINTRSRYIFSLTIILAGLWLSVALAHADIYYRVDDQGRKHFSDQLHPQAEEVEAGTAVDAVRYRTGSGCP